MSQYLDSKSLFQQPRVDQYNGHMVMTNVSKPSRFIYLNIDTAFCDDYSNNYSSSGCDAQKAQYTITLPERIHNVKCISILNAEIPMSFYNISESIGNNAFQYSVVGGSTYNVVIPDGSYTSASLVSEINDILSTHLLNSHYYLRCSLSGTKCVFDIIGTGGGPMAVSINFTIDSTGSVDNYLLKNKLGWMLGFHNTVYSIGSLGSSVTSEGVVFVSKPKYIYIAVDEFSKNSATSFHTALPKYQINKNILAKITLNPSVFGTFGTIIPANILNGLLVSDQRTYGAGGKTDIQRLMVQLLDDKGNVMVLNGCDFSFCLQIELE